MTIRYALMAVGLLIVFALPLAIYIDYRRRIAMLDKMSCPISQTRMAHKEMRPTLSWSAEMALAEGARRDEFKRRSTSSRIVRAKSSQASRR